MDISAVTSDGKSCQSIATKEICIFVANDDLTSCDIVVEMLQGCTYEVLHVGEATDGLKAIWERKDKLGLILTNVHRFNVEAFKILQNIQKQSNLRTILMSPDEAKIVLENQGSSSFTAYVLKFSNGNDFHNLWQSALVIEKAKWLEDDTQKALGKAEANTRSTPTIVEATQVHYKRKREANEKNEDNEDGQKEKKPRMVWTKEMHQKFVRAIEIIGYEKAFPKKILEVMNVPDLRRENVSRHLQTYRMSLKRVQDCSQLGSTYGMALESYAKEPCFSSGRSALHFNSSQGYSHLSRPLYRTQFWPGSSQIIPRPAQRHSFDVDANVSTFRSNLRRGQEVSTQGSMHQLCTPNASFSSSMPQKNNHMDVGNLQRIDQNGLTQYQSRYAPYKIMLNSNFRVYNDQRKNVLFSFKSGSSSVDCTPPASSDSGADFLGLRFTSDGKIEFGKTGSSSNNSQIKISEMLLPNRIQLQTTPPPSMVAKQSASLCPSTPASSLLEQQPSVPSPENYSDSGADFLGFRFTSDGKFEFGKTGSSSNNSQIKTSEMLLPNRIQLQTTPPPSMVVNQSASLCPSTPASSLLEQQPSVPSPENYSEENLVQLPSLLANCKIQQESPLTSLWIPEYVDHYSSTPVNNIPDQQQLLLPLNHAPGGETSAESSTMAANFVSQHQSSAPPICSSSNVDSLQYPSAPLTCNSQQLNPMLTFGTCEDETTAQCSSMAFTPYKEIFVPPLGSPVNYNTVQDPSTYLQCVSGKESLPPLPPELHEINSFGANGDLDVLLNATGSPSTNIAELFWDDEIDDIIYKFNINGD